MKKAVLKILFVIFLFSCISKYPLDLGNGYKLANYNRYYICVTDPRTVIVIREHIVDYSVDSTFIIAKQKPNDYIINNRELNYEESKELFEKSTFFQYWIINKKETPNYSYDTLTRQSRYSNVYGPFNKHEYLKKREELGVPEKLQLQENPN